MTQQELINYLESHSRKERLGALRESILTYLSLLIPFLTAFVISDHFLKFSPALLWFFFLLFFIYSCLFLVQSIKNSQVKLNLLYVARKIEKARPELKSCLSHCLSIQQDTIISHLEPAHLQLPPKKKNLSPL